MNEISKKLIYNIFNKNDTAINIPNNCTELTFDSFQIKKPYFVIVNWKNIILEEILQVS